MQKKEPYFAQFWATKGILLKSSMARHTKPWRSMAGAEGFEPPITGPKPVALPLGHAPIKINFIYYSSSIDAWCAPPRSMTDLYS